MQTHAVGYAYGAHSGEGLKERPQWREDLRMWKEEGLGGLRGPTMTQWRPEVNAIGSASGHIIGHEDQARKGKSGARVTSAFTVANASEPTLCSSFHLLALIARSIGIPALTICI
jgi:hypothetical protein